MELHNAIAIAIDFIERWNKNDKEQEVAEAAQRLQEYLISTNRL